MSENIETPADGGCLERAIAAGDLDTCRTELRRNALSSEERAGLYCRLGEAFYYRGQYADAVDCARTAFDLQSDCEAVADCCAWLFSNCRQHDEAALAYERLLENRPGWAAGHRHASGSFAVAGDFDRAIQHAARASELDPNSTEFAVHAGSLLTNAGLHRDAFDYFSRAAGIAADEPDVLRHLSACAFAIGDGERAIALALRAHALMPGERAHAHHATELLLRSDRFDDAAAVMTSTLAVDEADPIGYRLLSAAEMLRGRPEPALDAIERALAFDPDAAEYHLHRGNLLYRLARFDDAADAFRHAAALDPANPAAKRSQLTVYFDAGKFREAVAVGGELIQIEPDNEEYAQAVLQVLNRRFETLEGDYQVIADRPGHPGCRARNPACGPRRKPSGASSAP